MLPVEKVARPVPVPDAVTEPFWSLAAAGVLGIQRCEECERYQHPPAPLCAACGATRLGFAPVSGQARLHSWTLTHAGVRHPAFDARVPYLVGLVELVEQEGLLLYTNLPGAQVDLLRAGLELRVEFEHTDGVTLPQFHPVAG